MRDILICRSGRNGPAFIAGRISRKSATLPRLNVLAGSRRGTVLDLRSESVVIGRAKECDLVLLEEAVSRRHARILGRGDGYYVEDLGSRNGTFLNGNAIQQPTLLSHNDCIQLVDVALGFDGRPSPGPTEDTSQPGSNRSLPRSKRLAETVAQIDVGTFGADWTHANAASKLEAVLELSRGLQDAYELDHVQEQLLDALFRILVRMDRACLFRVEEHSERIRIAAMRSRGSSSDPSSTIAPLAWTVVEEALSQRQALLVSETETARNVQSSIHVPPTLSVMCAPLMDTSRAPLGALFVETSCAEQVFTHEDLDVLACVALLASRAVEQATLHSARYRAVVDHAADSIVTLCDDGRIESVNPAVQRQLGYEPSNLCGASITQVLPEFATSSLQLSSAPDETGEHAVALTHCEMTARRRDGSTFPASVSLGEFDLRGRRYYTATLRDITYQKQEEEHLQRLNEELEDQVVRRTKLIRLQQDVAVIANEAHSVAEAYSRVMRTVAEYMQWSVRQAWLCDGDNMDQFSPVDLKENAGASQRQKWKDLRRRESGAALSLVAKVVLSGKPCWERLAAGESSETPEPTALAFPVLLGRRVVGVLEFLCDADPPPLPQFKLLTHVGTQLGRIVERHFLQQQLVHAVWNQQRQFGQELHDTLGQQLTGIGMFAQALQQRLSAANHRESPRQAELVAMIQEAKQSARELAKSLQPVEIDAYGLPAALEDLARTMQQRSGTDCRFECDPEISLDDNEVATHLFRIAQEAVNNAVKHASAREIVISLSLESAKLCRMVVRDDGTGIRNDVDEGSGGMGIHIMKYRAQAIGAELMMTDANPGTLVACVLPLRRM